LAAVLNLGLQGSGDYLTNAVGKNQGIAPSGRIVPATGALDTAAQQASATAGAGANVSENQQIFNNALKDYNNATTAFTITSKLPGKITQEMLPDVGYRAMIAAAKYGGMSDDQIARAYGGTYSLQNLLSAANAAHIPVNPNDPIGTINSIMNFVRENNIKATARWKLVDSLHSKEPRGAEFTTNYASRLTDMDKRLQDRLDRQHNGRQ
jgi:hypothetical protein